MDRNDASLILLLASSSASLADAPGDQDNWIERTGPGGRKGELPAYVRKLARGIMKSGKTKSQAIAIAISRIKVWAGGGDDVDADTRAKAAKALAEWEALKAKNAAKQVVKASRNDGSEYLLLSQVGSFNTELVRRSWDAHERERRQAFEAAHPASRDLSAPASLMYPYSWIRELWTDYLVVEVESSDGLCFQKVPYTVAGTEVTFADPVPIQQQWVELPDDEELSVLEKSLLADVLVRRG